MAQTPQQKQAENAQVSHAEVLEAFTHDSQDQPLAVGAFAAVQSGPPTDGQDVQTITTVNPDGSTTTTVVTTTTVTTTVTTTTRTFVGNRPPWEDAAITAHDPALLPDGEEAVEQPAEAEAAADAATEITAPIAAEVAAMPVTETTPITAPITITTEAPSSIYPKPLAYRFFKRLIDIVFSLLVVVVGFIPGVLLCLAVRASTKGTAFYRQERVGQDGRRFTILKFRTMVADADDLEKHLTPEQLQEWHAEHKVDNDPRVTRLGGFLRRTSIDEFPNFLNVLAGQMSIVGPRAVTVEELRWYGDNVTKVLSVPAGVTGWWQVSSRNDATFEAGDRQQLELYYVDNASLGFDTRIFFKTFSAVFGETGK